MKWNRKELFQSNLTSKGCMRLLPNSSKGESLQQLVIANQNGVVWCLHWKKQAVVDFKTFPGPRIDAVTLGGAADNLPADKIFFSADSMINGYSRKGKHFLAFETNKTERIIAISCDKLNMVVCTENTMTHYYNCREMNHYLSEDKILDACCFEVNWPPEESQLVILLACESNVLKFLHGTTLLGKVCVGAPPNVLKVLQNDSDDCIILYATFTGSLGEVQVTRQGMEKKWEQCSFNNCSAINALSIANLSTSAQKNILLGRDDGLIEIYEYQKGQGAILLESVKCHECIVALDCGNFVSTPSVEIVACSYSGKIYTCTQQEPLAEINYDENVAELESELNALRMEVEQLKERVKEQKNKSRKMAAPAQELSQPSSLPMHDRLFLNERETAHHLSIELPVSIDWILLRSEVPIHLIDTEQNSAIFSEVNLGKESSEALMATYRCQANMIRFEVKLRTIEGKYGQVELYVCPRTNPSVCQVYDQSRPQNELKINGNFGILEAYSLMAYCLPGMPEHPVSAGGQLAFTFASCFMDTQLHFECREGEIVISTDNLSTLTILQDAINRAACSRGWKLTTSCKINKHSVKFVLQLIGNKLEEYTNLMRKINYAEILKEAAIYPDEQESLSPDFRDIVQNCNKYLDQKRDVEASMDRIKGFLTDLFVDSFKFKGQDVKHLVPKLIQIVENYDKDELVRFFGD